VAEAGGGQIGDNMDATRKYHRLALDCLQMAEAAHDPATQDALIRLAELWARLADRAESGAREGASQQAA
jgi:hypothetical protein